MSSRKPYDELSDRQKRRRLSAEYEKTSKEFNTSGEDYNIFRNKNIDRKTASDNVQYHNVEQIDDAIIDEDIESVTI